MVRGAGREPEERPPFDPLALQQQEEQQEQGKQEAGECGVGVVVAADGSITLIQLNDLPFPDLAPLYGILGRCRDDIALRLIKGGE